MGNDLVAAQLAHWGLTPQDATTARLFPTTSASGIYAEMPDRPGIVIPYFDLAGQQVTFPRAGQAVPYGRIRLLNGQKTATGWQAGRKVIRYTQPAHSPVLPYFWPGADWQVIAGDVAVPLIITEGEAKAIKGCVSGFTVIALGGVYSFTDAAGELLPQLAAITWAGRDVYVVYDSDAATNSNVLAAEARLVHELQSKRGARCHIVRLPEGQNKVGLDDFIIENGADALVAKLKTAPVMSGLDNKIIRLNKSVAWIEREGLVYDLASKLFINKSNFVKGSKYSSLSHITVGATQRTSVKRVSVADVWLTHPHALRYDEILFRPDQAPGGIVGDQGRSALNMWTGFTPSAQAHSVQPFLELTDHVFSLMRASDRELPLKLMIYKAQNPAHKVPLAVVMVGPEGSGKSLWGECIAAAFSPYSFEVAPSMLKDDFQGWLETSLIVLVNEAKGDDMRKAAETLRGLISDLKRQMNDKFRLARPINAYASYIITANDRAVGAFRADDRRMIVVGVPKPKEAAFYDRLHHWKKNGGGRALIHWMLKYDLKGWTPPARAPMSAEKHLSHQESMTPIQRLSEDMQNADHDTITMWLDSAVAWAQASELSNDPKIAGAARATIDNVQHYQLRPWYTPDELALMFPSITAQLWGNAYRHNTPSGTISRELRDAGIPYLISKDDARGFKWRGRWCQFLVISDQADWVHPIGQDDFERMMRSWPTYGQVRRPK